MTEHTPRLSLFEKVRVNLGKVGRDLYLQPKVIIATLIQALFTIFMLTAAILFIIDSYTTLIAFLALGIVIGAFFIGGIVLDYLKRIELVEIVCDSLCLVLYLLGTYLPEIRFIMVLGLMAVLPQIILITLSIMLAQTNMLNRGRYTFIMLCLVAATFGPVFFALQYFNFSLVVTTISLCSLLFLVIIGTKLFPLPWEMFQSVNTRVHEGLFTLVHTGKTPEALANVSFKLSLDEIPDLNKEELLDDLKEDLETGLSIIKNEALSWGRSLLESGLIPLTIISFIVATIIGFNFSISSFVGMLLDRPLNIEMFVVIILFSVFLGAIFIDYIGRKVVALITGLIMGFYSIFFDFITEFSYEYIWFILFPLSITLALLFLVAIVGDLTEQYRRGQTVSLLMIFIILGFVFGYSFDPILQLLSNLTDEQIIVAYSDFTASAVLLAMIVLNLTPETFQRASIHWRKYLDRLYILSESGIALYHYNFKRPADPDETESDLVSGGLSGLQSMIKEISHSNQQLHVLDHGDSKFIFNHGAHCTAILIASEYLPILKAKLAKFHYEFEFHNQARLANFTGYVDKWEKLKTLMRRYFDRMIP
jgi:hypothetical protein